MDCDAQLAGIQFGREIVQEMFSGKLSEMEMSTGEL